MHINSLVNTGLFPCKNFMNKCGNCPQLQKLTPALSRVSASI